MPTAKEYHRTAMRAYDIAEACAHFYGDTVLTRAKYRRAMRLEAAAADLLAPQLNNEPARSVIHRSAATMAIKAGEFAEAMRLIGVARAGRLYGETDAELEKLAEQCKAVMQA